jgi:hypothetical protein
MEMAKFEAVTALKFRIRPLTHGCSLGLKFDVSRHDSPNTPLLSQDLHGSIAIEPAIPILIIMSLYTVFAWAAIVIAGGTYYWVYIRQSPLSVGLFQKANARKSLGESSSVSQKRKRKSAAPKQRTAFQTNELLAGTSGISADESEGDAKSRQQVQDETTGLAERKELLGSLFKIYILTLCSRYTAPEKTGQANDAFRTV